MELKEELKNKCELFEEQNKEVNAGAVLPEIYTEMSCDACKYDILWVGDYMNGVVYDCPRCFAHAFHGTRYRL